MDHRTISIQHAAPVDIPILEAVREIQSEGRRKVVMPEGVEHISAEVASATIRSTGAIKFDTKGTHSSLAIAVQNTAGCGTLRPERDPQPSEVAL
jgi:hypothetical protein